jgi:hypothetical protein
MQIWSGLSNFKKKKKILDENSQKSQRDITLCLPPASTE